PSDPRRATPRPCHRPTAWPAPRPPACEQVDVVLRGAPARPAPSTVKWLADRRTGPLDQVVLPELIGSGDRGRVPLSSVETMNVTGITLSCAVGETGFSCRGTGKAN